MGERVHFGAVADHRGKADALFARVRERILRLVPGAIVEHVGSTALPDGLTKGDLDVQVRVSAEGFDDACRALASSWDDNPGGFTDRGRSFEDDSTDPPLGIHVTVIDGPSDIQSKQRDLLRARPGLRAKYDALKRRFEGGDMAAYREAKHVFFTQLPQPRIRPYVPADRGSCLGIFDSNTPAFFDASERDDFAAFLDSRRDRWVVVEEDAHLVACGGWGWRTEEPRIALLCWGMVHRDHQRAGIGTLLLAHRLAAIAKGDFDAIELVTSQHSAPFFSRAGFAETEITPNHFAPGLHAHRMRRPA